jgi:hypothetical protein
MRYIKVTRPDIGGSYINPISEIRNIIDGEFSDADPGDKITLELVEMSEEDYEKLPEFMGW